MSTKFSQAKSVKLPAVCHATLVGLPIPYLNGQPNRLSCLAEWVDTIAGLNVHESTALEADPSFCGWSGSSGDAGINLYVTVEIRPEPHHYTVTIILREGQLEVDDASWHDIFIPPGPPFDSGPLRHDYPPADSWDGVHLRD